MKGAILAGRTGMRLNPIIKKTNKDVLPVGKEPVFLNDVIRIFDRTSVFDRYFASRIWGNVVGSEDALESRSYSNQIIVFNEDIIQKGDI